MSFDIEQKISSNKLSVDNKWIPSFDDVDNYSSQYHNKDSHQIISSKADNKLKCIERIQRLVNHWIFSTNDTKLLAIELTEYLNNLKCDWCYLINNCWSLGLSYETNFKSDIMFLIEILTHSDVSVRRYLFANLFKTALNIYENLENELLYIVINCILEKIIILESESEIDNFLILIESYTSKPYTNCYYKFVLSQTINKFTINSKCLKIILKHIIEAWTVEHTHINIQSFESNVIELFKIINIKYIDILLAEIPNYQIKYTHGNIFNKLHVTYKLAIIGCTETLVKVLKCKKYNNSEFKCTSLEQIKSNDTLSSNYPDLELGLKNETSDDGENHHDIFLEEDTINNSYFYSLYNCISYTLNIYTCSNIIQTNIYNMIQVLIDLDE
jgi:hypothetical protein